MTRLLCYRFKDMEALVRNLDPPRYTRACAYCTARVSEHAYKQHLVALHSDCLFHCDECDTYVDRKEFILHMSTHAAEYAAKQEKKPVMRAKMLLNNKTDRRDENENDERRKCNRRTAKIADRSQVDDEPSPAPRYVDEFSDHSDAENGFEPLPESVFEAIEDSQDSRPPESIAPTVDFEPTKEPGEVKKTLKTKKCLICGREFAARSSYFYHMKHFHAQTREHECTVCRKRFGTKATLAEHEHIHSGARPYACERCGKQFGSRASLYIHEQTHGGVKRWKCTQCPRAFRWRTQLARHASRHAARRDHECGKCDRSFNVHADLLRHARTHEKQDHVCERCGLHFAQLRYLKVHTRNKHAEEEDTSGAAEQNRGDDGVQ
ncbi:unnamed protein product [Chilo suppressalis]|uniref:C2H2-type domain-containing protein n=1 Tax=Chilo suppressalis TaxID=168631 RepID=A0ABN8LC84_CHISP|nr:unnamed protein product [Chilo suppressalis]